MAVVTVAFDGTRLSQAESETDGGTWDKWDSANSPTQETDFVYQRGASNAAISNKVGTKEGGVEFEDSSTEDLATSAKWVLFKVIVTNYAALNTIGSTAMVLYIGSGTTTDRYNYYVHGSDTYPPAGGWVFVPVDPNRAEYRDATDGTPSLTAADYYAISCTFTGTSKSENVAMDAVDIVPVGKGLTLTRGDSTDADGTLDDFISADEGTVANRWGIVRSVEGVAIVTGKLTIGESATATEYTDSNRTIVFPDGRVAQGAFGVECDIGNAGTTITIDSYTFVSRGRDDWSAYFDTDHEVTNFNDRITITDGHQFVDGDAVQYRKNLGLTGNTESIGLTDNSTYFVEVINSTNIELHTTRQGAMTSGTPVSLTASTSGNGEDHELRRIPDVRGDLDLIGTAGTGSLTNSTFLRCRNVQHTTAQWTLTGCRWIESSEMHLGADGAIDNCEFVNPLLQRYGGTVITSTSDPSNISNCKFSKAATLDHGHAIYITAAGTYTFSGNTFENYWTFTGDAGAGVEINALNDVDVPGADQIEVDIGFFHGFETGEQVYYNNNGGTNIGGLVTGRYYYARVISGRAFSLHLTRYGAVNNVDKIALTPGSNETHAFYSAGAAIRNSSNGLVTINVTGGGDTPTVLNTGAGTAVVNNTVSLVVTATKPGGAGVDGARVRIENTGGTLISEGTTNASGVYTDSTYSYGGDVSVNVIVRLKGFKNFSAPATITASGLDVPAALSIDPTVNLP